MGTGVIGSKFTINTEGWKCGPPAYQSTNNCVHSPTSIGNKISIYIYSNGGTAQVGQQTTGRWFFESPAKFAIDNSLAYDGYLTLAMLGMSGAFQSSMRPDPYSLVCLVCDSCAMSTESGKARGITLCQRSANWTGNARIFQWQLNEISGWLRDPLDERVTQWSAVTRCEFLEVLTFMNAIVVHGDATEGTESVALDDVIMTFGRPENIYDPVACEFNTTTLAVFKP